jgi:hypothetical protein
MNSERLIELGKQAEEIAECVTDAYKTTMFARALDELIKDQSFKREELNLPKSSRPLPKSQSADANDREEKLKTILGSHLDVGEAGQILDNGGTLERSLLVMEMIEKQFGLSELMPPEMAKILSQNLGISTTANAVSMALKKVTNLYVRRRSGTQGFLYLLTPAGREYLKSRFQGPQGVVEEV